MLRVDPRNPRAADLADALSAHVDLETIDSDVCVVIGGDGHLLHTIQELGTGLTYLGLNAGTLGFLLNDAPDDGLADIAADLRDGRWSVVEFPMLAMEAERADIGSSPALPEHTLRAQATVGGPLTAQAVNDIYIERMSSHIAQVRLSIDGTLVVQRLACDGLIIATALGSTAYSFSAGASPCHPLVRAVQVTPICPHAPRLSPITLPWGSTIEVEVLAPDRRPVRAVSDGVEQGAIRRLRAAPADGAVKLAFLDGHDFTATLVRKIVKA